MKKLMLLLLATLMVLSNVTAFAGQVNTNGDSTSTTLVYGVEQSYVVTIPDRVVITDELSEFNITAEDILIPKGALLKVVLQVTNSSYDGASYWLTSPTSGDRLPYLIYQDKFNADGIMDTTIAAGDTLAAFDITTPSVQTTYLHLVRMQRMYADSYTDRLTFVIGLAKEHEITDTEALCPMCDYPDSYHCAECGLCTACSGTFCWDCNLCASCHGDKGYACTLRVNCLDCHRWYPTEYMCWIGGDIGQCKLCCGEEHSPELAPEVFFIRFVGTGTQPFAAPTNTTWEQYASSPYNIAGVTIQNGVVVINNDTLQYNGVNVKATDVIANVAYQMAGYDE